MPAGQAQISVPYNNVTGIITIPDGACAIGVINTGTADGIINGSIVPAGISMTLQYIGGTYGEIEVDGTGTNLYVTAFYNQAP